MGTSNKIKRRREKIIMKCNLVLCSNWPTLPWEEPCISCYRNGLSTTNLVNNHKKNSQSIGEMEMFSPEVSGSEEKRIEKSIPIKNAPQGRTISEVVTDLHEYEKKAKIDGEKIKERMEKRDDIVVRPSHYTQFKIEPITFIMRNSLPFHTGNIVKYALRAGHKLYEGKTEVESEILDLEKARRYAEMRINQLKGEEIL